MEEMESVIHTRKRNLICGNGLKCDILKHCYRPLVFQVGKARNLSLSDSKSNQHRIAINWWWWGLYTVHCTLYRWKRDYRWYIICIQSKSSLQGTLLKLRTDSDKAKKNGMPELKTIFSLPLPIFSGQIISKTYQLSYF